MNAIGHSTDLSRFQPWSAIQLFWQIARRSFQRHLTYRAATIAGLLTNLFFGILRVAVLVALFGARQEMDGFSVRDAITFTGLSQGIIAYLSIFGWYDVMNSISSGEVASDLLKPLNYMRFWLAIDFGRALVALLLRGATMILLYALLFDLTWPQDAVQWLAVGTSLLLSLLVSFGWRFLVNLSAFWSSNARGVGRFAFGLAWALSGFFMPLRFFPDWFVTFCKLTPFPAMVNTTVEVYLGLLTGYALVQALLIQAFWVFLLFVVCQMVLRAGVRQLVVQGG